MELYVEDRKLQTNQSSDRKKIPITVRQLEAIIRLSESFAKMRMTDVVTEKEVEVAHDLFTQSTLKAIKENYNGQQIDNREMNSMIIKIEEYIKNKVPIGSKITYNKLEDELNSIFDNSVAVQIAIINMSKREELQYYENRKMIFRKK